MKTKKSLLWIAGWGALGALVLWANAASNGVIIIKGGRILPMNGEVLESGVVLIEGGRIKQVGKDLPVPADAVIVDAGQGWVLPGLVEAHSHLGLLEPGAAGADELSNPNEAPLLVLDGINPFNKRIRYAAQAGVTTALVAPGSGNVIGGQAAVIKLLYGKTVAEIALLSPAGVLFSLGEGPKSAYGEKGRLPSTRMGSAYVVRKALIEAQEFQAKMKAYESKKGQGKDEEKPKRDLAVEPLAELIDGGMTAFIECYRADDIMTALRIVDEFKLKAVLVGCTEGPKVAEEIARRNIPVVVGPLGIGSKRVETEEAAISIPAVLAKAGVKVVVHAEDELGVGAQEELPLAAALAMKGGLGHDQALRAITLTAAEVLGVADRVGSLEPGKDADVVIFNGNPLDYRTRVDKVLINGVIIFDRKN
jgi:imidazolonepropionase-like amidohydrolase